MAGNLRYLAAMKSFSRGFNVSYEILLRTIGQELESKQANSFKMEIRGKKVFVSGGTVLAKSKRRQPDGKNDSMLCISERIVKMNNTRPEQRRSQSSPRTFRDRYAVEDIYRLDQERKAQRKDPDRIPNGQSISQVLRAVGAYVSRKEARLSSLAVRDGIIEIVYETVAGKPNADIFRWPTQAGRIRDSSSS